MDKTIYPAAPYGDWAIDKSLFSLPDGMSDLVL
jgi:hypothetical protein